MPSSVCAPNGKDTFVRRRMSSRIGNGVRNLLTGDKRQGRRLCGIKVDPSRRSFLRVPRFVGMHRFMATLVRYLGGVVVEQDVNHRPARRRHGQVRDRQSHVSSGLRDCSRDALGASRDLLTAPRSRRSSDARQSSQDGAVEEYAVVLVGDRLRWPARCSRRAFGCSGLPASVPGSSVVPISFWYLSLSGGLMSLCYAIYRLDPVFIMGQVTGLRHLCAQSDADPAIAGARRLTVPAGRVQRRLCFAAMPG